MSDSAAFVPYYEDEWATLYCGDAAEILPTLDVTPDLLVTDPPYGISYQSNKREATEKFALIEGDGTLEVAEAVLSLHSHSCVPGGPK